MVRSSSMQLVHKIFSRYIHSSKNLKTKTVLITGSTSGIGLGIARVFAASPKEKYNIVLHGLEENGANISHQLGKEFEIQTDHSNANCGKPEELIDLVERINRRFGSIDILINNAGIQHVSPIENFPGEKWQAIIDINLSSIFHLSKAVWPKMQDNNWGRIINVASVHGLRASEYKTAYVASKHGALGLSKVLALEGARYNITSNCICPGYVKTPIIDKQIKDQAKVHGIDEDKVVSDVILKKHVIKKFIPTETIGEMAFWLASDSAAAVTGTSISLDAGWQAN
ncbi:hypothetical protein SNEBB_007535 [Seison nebaliae]|nr:hypothetical protein SNEBB_007535 [Seison nebaliae]